MDRIERAVISVVAAFILIVLALSCLAGFGFTTLVTALLPSESSPDA
jgi:hypothetical protein